MLNLYRKPALTEAELNNLLREFQDITDKVVDIKTEWNFNIESERPLDTDELQTLQWLLAETFQSQNLKSSSHFEDSSDILEVEPRLNFETPWSTNAVNICHACGITPIKRLERSKRYILKLSPGTVLEEAEKTKLLSLIHDRMTEEAYPKPLASFESNISPEPLKEIDLIVKGVEELVRVNRELGLGMDEQDISNIFDYFKTRLGRNPTDAELIELGNANSEHSRHHFFKGKLIIDGVEMPETLLEIVKSTLKANPGNSVLAFSDNSSAIRGFEVTTILPVEPLSASPFVKQSLFYHVIFTAETHNFPTGVAPFPGATTGTGGRIRDNNATGRGSLVIAGTAGYSVGNLLIPDYKLPWEEKSWVYPSNLATPLEIEIEASNGASDYGNKFGEPIILGFTRSFGLEVGNERQEYIKPIMFTGGISQIDARHLHKKEPYADLLIIQIGGPAYRIGLGGGAASSMIQGENIEELDFNAVQRGDPEMEQKMNRVVRAMVELGDKNPIVTITDLGAGGDCNAIPELIYPTGGRINLRAIPVGDKTLSVLEIWGNESQERDVFIIKPEALPIVEKICAREKCPMAVIGETTGDGKIVVYDEIDSTTPVSLNLVDILGKIPQKTWEIERIKEDLEPLKLPNDLTIPEALERVLKLLSVGSKRFLTNKVDRSVTGLVAQQQCVGSLHLPLANCAVTAQSHLGFTGMATSIGEQPIKMLVNPAAGARMAVGEAITNIASALIGYPHDVGNIKTIKFSANWMWPAKLPGEGAKIYDAAVAARDLMIKLGIAVDGGKDSLSMAAQVVHDDGTVETVKSPGTLVISAYAPCPDIRKVVTPDIKEPGKSQLMFIDLAEGKTRLGGSALAQVFKQIGNKSPDVDNPEVLKAGFEAIQELISKNLILSCHDRSDGGLIVTLLEMVFSGNCGLDLDFSFNADPIAFFFNEELGLVIEYLRKDERMIKEILRKYGITSLASTIGETTKSPWIYIKNKSYELLEEPMVLLRDTWEETSYQLELRQANPKCVKSERSVNFERSGHKFELTFEPEPTPLSILEAKTKPKVTIIREEGSNGDREMASAFYLAGFEPWDVTMTDLLHGNITLKDFKGTAFVGGFSYSDVLDSAKGWAGVIKFNPKLQEEFDNFYRRQDTFSLGVCNGCQLMANLGLVPWQGMDQDKQPRFIRNESGRFESRYPTVKIMPSPAIILQGMEGSTLGIWVAHGEGRAYFPEKKILYKTELMDLVPLRYVDDNGSATETYPYNPNGSPLGIAAICSPDGQHLAMMPHPERLFIDWQFPWMPNEWKNLKASPWLKLFQNAYNWAVNS